MQMKHIGTFQLSIPIRPIYLSGFSSKILGFLVKIKMLAALSLPVVSLCGLRVTIVGVIKVYGLPIILNVPIVDNWHS